MVRGSRQTRTNRMIRNRWESELQKCSGAYDLYGNALDQDNVYSLAKEKPGVILEWKFL
jgi:hypothetical protein